MASNCAGIAGGRETIVLALAPVPRRRRRDKGAILDSAELYGAHLGHASLIGTHLNGATLTRADLQNVSLVGAELQDAALYYAELQTASLEHGVVARGQGLGLRRC